MNFSFAEHVALFGGAFNPPHLGHKEAVKGLLKDPGVKQVIVVPTYGNPLKVETTPYENRFEMAKLNFPGFEVSDFERKKQSRSSFELLSDVKALTHGLPVAFVIGTDQFESLYAWKNFPQVLHLCDWIVLLRKPKRLDDVGGKIKEFEGHGVMKATRDPYTFEIRNGSQVKILRFVHTDAPEVSATAIRESLALGHIDDAKKYLQGDVLSYVERNKLYGTSTNHSN